MWEYVKNMKRYVENIKKYVGSMKKFSPFIWALGPGKIPRPSFLLGSGTWKNSEPHPRLWDLEKLRALPLYRLRDLKKFISQAKN